MQKSGPRVFMPSSVTTNAANMVVNSSSSVAVNATSSWPSLDNNPPSSTMSGDLPQQIQQNKPKTFASVAATKKAPPPPPPQPVRAQPPPSVNHEGTSAVARQSFENKQHQDTPNAVPEMAKSGGGEESGRVTEYGLLFNENFLSQSLYENWNQARKIYLPPSGFEPET